MKILGRILIGVLEILIVLLLSLVVTQFLSSCQLADLGLANTAAVSAPNPAPAPSPSFEQKVDKSKKKKQQPAEAPKPFFFVDWAVPDFEFALRPILGMLYESISVPSQQGSAEGAPMQQVGTITVELGARAALENVSLPGDSLKFTVSPEIGYAYGQRTNLEKSSQATSQLQEGSYHRVLVGNTARLYLRFFRYSLGLHFGRIFGDLPVAVPMNQGEVMQDLGIKTTASSSVHTTVTTGRNFEESPAKFLSQRSDVWLHVLFNPVSPLLLDFGPGKEFTRLPQAREMFSNTYFKLLVDLGVFGNFGVAGGVRYVFSAEESRAQNDGQNALEAGRPIEADVSRHREPFRDLGSTARKAAARADDARIFFFAGLRRLYSVVSLGYLCNYDFVNTFEKNGRREKEVSQGFGVFTQLDF